MAKSAVPKRSQCTHLQSLRYAHSALNLREHALVICLVGHIEVYRF